MEKYEVSPIDSIKMVALQTFAKRTDTKSKDNNKVNALKKDVPLVSHLFYICSQGHILIWMNSLSMRTKESHHLYLTKESSGLVKSRIIQCLAIPKVTSTDHITVIILSAPAVVHMIRPTKATDFQQYVDHHFIPYVASVISESTSRVDIIWDTYPDHYIKARA